MDAQELEQDLTDPAAYRSPSLRCDVVMKGGITSGVTYPWAVCEIARTYRLKSVGGSSAGAIAAAAAAAAEAGRDTEDGGFVRLAQLPSVLGEPATGGTRPTLFTLFQPAPATRPYFAMLDAASAAKGGMAKGFAVAASGLRSFRRWAVLGAIPGAVVTGLAIGALVSDPGLRGSALAWIGLIAAAMSGLVLAIAGQLVATTVAAVRGALRAIPANMFGLCTGYVDKGTGPPALTTWLADELDGIAGKEDPAEPLTLGDLKAHDVRLQMLTTNLTEGTPYVLPFRNRRFFFKPEELRRLFPARVVDWMVAKTPTARPGREAELFARMEDQGALPLPAEDDLPVILLTRMSLSFPILLSAVPLWFADWTDPTEPGAIKEAWFSDGGITSNFPIHFFDRPLPRWPTFGINLGPFPADRAPDPDQSRNVWAPDDNAGGILPRWSRIAGVPGFIRAVLDTMQNWADNSQIRVPGYRDRIVLIRHSPEEGGLNLNMPADRIRDFSLRGGFAGRLLVDRFSRPPEDPQTHPLSWDNHRWVRYRSLMALLEDELDKLRTGFEAEPQASHLSYRDLILRELGTPPTSYPLTAAQRPFAEAATLDLVRLIYGWEETDQTFRDPRVPRPTPQLRITPSY